MLIKLHFTKTSTHENGKNKKIKLLKKGELQPEFNGFDIFTVSKDLLIFIGKLVGGEN